ncbi:hypothetical protein Trydic_g19969 [Trypoxylus dichotomus]
MDPVSACGRSLLLPNKQEENDESQLDQDGILRPAASLGLDDPRRLDQNRKDRLAKYFMSRQGSIPRQWICVYKDTVSDNMDIQCFLYSFEYLCSTLVR